MCAKILTKTRRISGSILAAVGHVRYRSRVWTVKHRRLAVGRVADVGGEQRVGPSHQQ